MIFQPEIARKTALHLLQIGAIQLNPENPFTWASGLRSPIYCDNRLTLSYPAIRTFIRNQLSEAIRARFANADLIVGVATAGIPQGVLIAQEMGLPFAYVRSSAKAHGMTNRIEGHLRKEQHAVVVEDLVSTGKSSLAAVEALREAGIRIAGMVAVFTYELAVADENFRRMSCPLTTLSDYHHLMQAALSENYISKPMLESLYQWRENPQKWSETHAK
jgi:orotate phosphoribosyltransferase